MPAQWRSGAGLSGHGHVVGVQFGCAGRRDFCREGAGVTDRG